MLFPARLKWPTDHVAALTSDKSPPWTIISMLNLCIAIVEAGKKSLEDLAAFSHAKLENKLVKNNQTMPQKIAPNAYCSTKKAWVMERGLCEKHTQQGKQCRKNSVIFGKSLS